MRLRFSLATLIGLFFQLFVLSYLQAQIIEVGSGSYTNSFPGTDAAGRNGFPSGSPQLSGDALGKPVPTNDWWSALLNSDHAANLFNYPMAMKTKSSGLMLSYIPSGVLDDQEPIIIGVADLNASKTTVSDYSDWTVSMDWDGEFQARSGIGMPFIYFEKSDEKLARVSVNLGTVTVMDEVLLITDARNGADFAIYAPLGSTWVKDGSSYTSTLNDKNYWSAAMLPQSAADPGSIVNEYKRYAYVFPVNTSTEWVYNELEAKIKTTFSVETEIKEGADSTILLGLLPHQWGNLSADSPRPMEYSYTSIRGELKTLQGNAFSVENTFFGILPTLPYLSNYSIGFDPAELDEKIRLLENDGLATWTDSYNEGQMMNRLIQTARVADKMGNIKARDKMIATIKERLEDWLTAETSEVAFLFYYNSTWTALLGYPAGHGQDNNINDHHFHWGYFIHAAAFMEQFQPGWATEWGDIVNYLVRDAASADRNDPLFPYLRNFSPYAGHCWANGFASFPGGNDQESTSESMQFNSSLIHWGSITGNEQIRDLGIYLYTTEQSAVEEYWFDVNDRVLTESHPYSLVSRVWGNSYDNGTFWTSDIEASYGIELYPIHGGSMYLGQNTEYASKLWEEIERNTGILSNDDNVNLWHDVMWKYLSFTDPQKAIELYNSYPDRNLKFGVSDAQTYYWLHSMNAIGQIDTSITADHPLAVVFNKEGNLTYVAHNYSGSDLIISFSDGYELNVAANSMRSNRDLDLSGNISSSFSSSYPGGSVILSLDSLEGVPEKVEYYKNGTLLGESTTAPFEYKAADLSVGVHTFYAKLIVGDAFNVTNIIRVESGEQEAYSGSPSAIPGSIEAGHYDVFPGSKGQGIAYLDLTPGNDGDFRPEEYVDASSSSGEGTLISHISGGEWLEYSVDVAQSGRYDFMLRYASGNQNGGGPMHLELDGSRISDDIYLQYTGDWDSWASKTIEDIELAEGEHVLRLVFDHGEFNLAKMTFTYKAELSYGHPVANAGENISLMLPASTTSLDGSESMDPDGGTIFYSWIQMNGPSNIVFTDTASVTPVISELIKGVYTLQLTVSDGTHFSSDIVYVAVSETGNMHPTVSITAPSEGTNFEEGADIVIQANATDLEGDITLVEFFDGDVKIGEDDSHPFSFVYTNPDIGTRELTARASDGDGAVSVSELLSVHVVEVKECKKFSDEAAEGSFSKGYFLTFKSVGTDLTITFELLDTDKADVFAFLRQESPFTEVELERVSGKIFSTTLRGFSPGTTVSYGCKIAYAGGLSATKYFSYEVGTECEEVIVDLEAPRSFTASAGEPASDTLVLKMSATDNSGSVIYTIKYNSISEQITGVSGLEIQYVVESLEASTNYDFYVTAEDSSGNKASNSPIKLSVTTPGSTGLNALPEPGQSILLYPNPVETKITVAFAGNQRPESWSVLDVSGARHSVEIYDDQELLRIDLSQLPAGIYLMQFNYATGPVYRKVVKQ